MVELNSEILKKLRSSKKRKFNQTVDLIVNLSNLNLKKPENRIRERIKLPYKIRDVKICFIVDSLISVVKDIKEHKVITKSDIQVDKKEGKKLAKNFDFFVVEAPLMPIVAKTLGKYAGPRNKPIVPIPPAIKDIKKVVEDLEKTIQINVINNPIVQIPIGDESMKDEEIIKNFNTFYDKLEEIVKNKKAQIKSIYIKLTMSQPIKL
ncbi:MAG: hypothetical protein B6U88_01310 [Candidatus Aenigmarchaeota archaeon ex4484_56]|nr:MAG: hypothetical protein B6U88_01310 [Candidatus Aenigmarchaeota archaeon ex4484_56]